jgi:hypothetical protein
VHRFPIISVTTLETKQSETLGWVAVSPAPDFMISPSAAIIELSIALADSRSLARVTYAGGYVLPGATAGVGQTALPADLEQATVEQCCYWYQRRQQLGLVSVSGDGGSVSQYRTLDLLPSVSAVLSKYERLML